MTDADALELLHIEETDSRGRPTGHARCDRGDGTFPGGLLAVNSGTATCEACIEREPDGGGEPDDGDHGTCAICGGRIRYQACPTGGWWIHDTRPGDGHDALLGGPA